MSGVQRAVPAGGMEGGGAKQALQRVDGDADVYVWGSVFGCGFAEEVKSASVGARGGDMRRGGSKRRRGGPSSCFDLGSSTSLADLSLTGTSLAVVRGKGELQSLDLDVLPRSRTPARGDENGSVAASAVGRVQTFWRFSASQKGTAGAHTPRVSCGRAHSAWVDGDSGLWVQGHSVWGQCGSRLLTTWPVFRRIFRRTESLSVRRVATGSKHTLILLECGAVFAMGYNKGGLLGVGNPGPSVARPTPVIGFGAQNTGNATCADATCADVMCASEISAGDLHSTVVTTDGDVYSWGDGLTGCLGHGNRETETKPKRVEWFKTRHVKAIAVSCGLWHTLVLSDIGDVYTFGRNDDGQLGRPNAGPISFDPGLVDLPPNKGQRSEDIFIAQIAAGARHSLARSIGQGVCVYGWGYNRYGQICPTPRAQRQDSIRSPMRLTFACTGPPVWVAAGQWTSLAAFARIDSSQCSDPGASDAADAKQCPPMEPSAPAYAQPMRKRAKCVNSSDA